MFGILPEVLQYWYKNILSNYLPDIENGKWHPQKIETVDTTTGAITEKPVYIFKEENLGEKMSIDDKSIKHEGFTILSNHATHKIAMMIESTKSEEIKQAMQLFGNELEKVKTISMDMSPTYALVASDLMPQAIQIIDKFHVMKHVYEAVSAVRINIKKEISNTLTKEKKITEEDKKKLSELEQIRRIRHAITQSPNKWSKEMSETINQVFEKYENLKIAYQIGQNFKNWYDYRNCMKSNEEIKKTLSKWYQQARQIKEFKSVVRMIQKHEDKIINFFRYKTTNAKAENLNGKIQRFVSNNYGVKNKDFILYRMAGYFS